MTNLDASGHVNSAASCKWAHMWHISTLFRTINWRLTWSKVLFEKLSVVQLLCNFTLCI